MTLFNGKTEISSDQVLEYLDLAVSRVYDALPRFTYRSQNHSSVNNIYPAVNNDQWTSGFWVGQIWLSYLHTKNPVLKHAGLIQAENMLARIEAKNAVDHHDMGFLYTPSCTAAWAITGYERARRAALLAADQLMGRFQERGGFFQAWGEMGAASNYRFIIDCLMNLPLLYWATEQTGNASYAEKANVHAATCLSHSIREDGSTFHTFFMDPSTGEGVRGETCQGYNNDSSWARGQAWAIYGAALAYRYTNDRAWLNVFYRTAAYFLNRLPDDLVPYWDLIFVDGDEPRDSSSAVIAACGLLEMASLLNGMEADQLKRIASQLMAALVPNYVAVGDTDGLLLHGTYSKKTPFNTCTQEGVNECLTWGDYFYLEALLRLHRIDWKPYW